MARLGIEPRTSCSASQELNHWLTITNTLYLKFYMLLYTLHLLIHIIFFADICKDRKYNPALETCCDGVLSPPGFQSCCGNTSYSPETLTCCNGSLFLGRKQDCYGRNAYRPDIDIFLKGRRHSRDINNRRSCGTKSYNPEHQTCCNGHLSSGECHCWWTRESPMAHVAKFYARLWLIRSVLRASIFCF